MKIRACLALFYWARCSPLVREASGTGFRHGLFLIYEGHLRWNFRYACCGVLTPLPGRVISTSLLQLRSWYLHTLLHKQDMRCWVFLTKERKAVATNCHMGVLQQPKQWILRSWTPPAIMSMDSALQLWQQHKQTVKPTGSFLVMACEVIVRTDHAGSYAQGEVWRHAKKMVDSTIQQCHSATKPHFKRKE